MNLQSNTTTTPASLLLSKEFATMNLGSGLKRIEKGKYAGFGLNMRIPNKAVQFIQDDLDRLSGTGTYLAIGDKYVVVSVSPAKDSIDESTGEIRLNDKGLPIHYEAQALLVPRNRVGKIEFDEEAWEKLLVTKDTMQV